MHTAATLVDVHTHSPLHTRAATLHRQLVLQTVVCRTSRLHATSRRQSFSLSPRSSPGSPATDAATLPQDTSAALGEGFRRWQSPAGKYIMHHCGPMIPSAVRRMFMFDSCLQSSTYKQQRSWTARVLFFMRPPLLYPRTLNPSCWRWCVA